MESKKQNILFEKDIKVNPLYNIYDEMETENANENAQKIETPFGKKLKANKQEDLLAKANTDTNMNTITETKTLTKGQIAYQKQKAKKEALKAPAVKIIVEESDDEVETCKVCGEVEGEEQYEGCCETCYAEKLGHHAQATDQQESDEEESDEEEEDEEEEEEAVAETPIQTLTNKITLTKEQLADLENQRREIEAKAEYDAWFNNKEQVEEDTMTYWKAEVAKACDVLTKAGINRFHYHLECWCDSKFNYDDIEPETIELVWNFLKKKTAKSAPKAKGEKKERTAPTYEGKGKKAGTGDARKKDIANLNAGKTDKVKYAKKVGNKTWSLMFEDRKDGGLAVVKDSKGVYDIPVFKEVGGMVGISIKTKQEYIDWVKK